jgi:hypothetical protein
MVQRTTSSEIGTQSSIVQCESANACRISKTETRRLH